jgi:hypothetical protein
MWSKKPRPVEIRVGPSTPSDTSTSTSVSRVVRRTCARRLSLRIQRAIADAEVGRKFEVGVAVADHVAPGPVGRVVRDEIPHQADVGLAAGAVLPLEVRADEHRLELDAL